MPFAPKVFVPPVIVPALRKKPEVIVLVAPVKVRVFVPIFKRVSVALPFIVRLFVTVIADAAVTVAEVFEIANVPNVVAPVIVCAAVPLKVTVLPE